MKLKQLLESPDHIKIGKRTIEYHDRDAYSFVEYKGIIYFSQPGKGHYDMIPDVKAKAGITKDGNFNPDWDHFSGRIWKKTKVISFWTPPTQSALKSWIKKLNKFGKESGVKITGDWYVESSHRWLMEHPDVIPYAKGDKSPSGKYWIDVLVPIKYYTGKPPKMDKAARLAHMQSPLDKKNDKSKLAKINKARAKKGRLDAKGKAMSTKYKFSESVLKESPDAIDIEADHRLQFNHGGYPFGWYKGMAYVGIMNVTHANNMFNKNTDRQPDAVQDRPDWNFAGRLWPKYRVMSFWEYPTSSQLDKLIKELNVAFKANDESIRIDPKTWSIEVVKDKSGKWKRGFIGDAKGYKYDWDQDFLQKDYTSAIIPITKFAGSVKRSESDRGKAHLLSPLVKNMGDVRKKLATLDKARAKKGHVTAKQRAMATKYKFSEHINESPDAVNLPNGKTISYLSREAFPFVYKIREKKLVVSKDGGVSHGRLDLDGPYRWDGRVWKNVKVISFWDMPKKSGGHFDKFMKMLNKELMRIHKFKVTDNWLVDIYDEKGFIKKEYGDQAYYKDDHAVMPLKLWKGGPVAVNIKAKMQHLMSPLEKKGNKDRKKNYIKGRNKKYGSKLPIAQQKAMKTKNKFSESYMMEQMLYEGKVEKAAESFLSDMVKKSPWKGKVYIAGGYVRDELLGRDPKDIDIVVASDKGGVKFAKWITKKLGIYRSGSNPILYPKFGTSQFRLTGIMYKGIDLSEIEIEAVMTRKEQYEDGNRKPNVSPGTIEDDVKRRDFTVNSLLKDLTTGEILDLTGMGKRDLESGIIRTAIDPNIIFNEDPLRMLRAIRFTVKYNWKLPLFMIKALKRNSKKLSTISYERIRSELDKMLITSHPDKAIRLLQMTGLNKQIAPELDKLIGLKQNKYHDVDAMKHTLRVVKGVKPDVVNRLAAMFHDIGKAKTRTLVNSEIHFYKHEKISAYLTKKILIKLKYPNHIITAVVAAISNHMRTKAFGKDGELASDKALRKFKTDLGDHLEATMDLIDSDNRSHATDYNMPDQVTAIDKRLKKLGATKDITLPINGDDIMRAFNIKGGPDVGIALVAVKDAWFSNPKITKREALKIAKKAIGK